MILIRFFQPHWINTSEKKKWIRGNQKPHTNKTLRKAFMLSSKLKNWENASKDTRDIKMYNI